MIRASPLFLSFEEKVEQLERDAVIRGVQRALNTNRSVELRDLGVWREPGYKINDRLVPYQSVDWYVHQGRVTSRDPYAVNAEAIREAFRQRPTFDISYYEVIIVAEDMYLGESLINVMSIEGLGVVFSVSRYRTLSNAHLYLTAHIEREVRRMLSGIPSTLASSGLLGVGLGTLWSSIQTAWVIAE